ncbi:MAG TPA: class I SAM-dependent methyltransferase [Acidimicrobiales bacterium]|nr:class I SAM-dependent methyltransferase [Acidimicrobiales bacterium]
MKHGAGVHPPNQSESDRMILALAGRDRRVLDIGCGPGELGAALRQQGSWVAGVEADEAAAEAAEAVLDEVVTGEPGDVDLVGHFGKASFDVVVLRHVLRQVPDPVGLLRKVRLLLVDDGAVLVSVPNVAHGSVRLALLAGRFERHPGGAPEAAPARFFTHGSLHQLLRDAGLVPLELRRTKAGVFDTETDLRREDFDPVVVDAVEGDAESTTYEFVVRAVPYDAIAALDAPVTPVPAAGVRNRIGLWWSGRAGDLRSALEARITAAELERRFPGVLVRSFAWAPDAGAGSHDAGMPVERLGPWTPARAAELGAQLDCVVVTGEVPPAGSEEARFLADGFEPGADCPVLWSAVPPTASALNLLDAAAAPPAYAALLDTGTTGAPGAVPDPLVLAARLVTETVLRRRLDLCRFLGSFPAEGSPVVMEVGGGVAPHAVAVAAALDEATAGAGAVLVPVGEGGAEAAVAVAAALTGPAYRLPDDAPAEDIMAIVAAAGTVVASSTAGAALALAFGRPLALAAFAGDPGLGTLAERLGAGDAVAAVPAMLAAVVRAGGTGPTSGRAVPLQDALDAHFDRVAAVAGEAATRQRAPFADGSLTPEYVSALRVAHRRMQERLDAERLVVAAHIDVLVAAHREELERVEADRRALRVDALALPGASQALDDAATEAEDLRRRFDQVSAELQALNNTRMLRTLRPARDFYARVRRWRRP